MRLKDRVAIVVGAGQSPGEGIGNGRATALTFAREGAKVWANDVNAKTIGELDGKEGIRARVLDVTNENEINKISAEAGDIDVLFNCAGIVHHGSILDASVKDWDQAFAVNVKSMFLVSKAFIPGMLKKGKGSIINTASFVAVMGAATSQISYTASKGGVLAMSRELGVQFAR